MMQRAVINYLGCALYCVLAPTLDMIHCKTFNNISSRASTFSKSALMKNSFLHHRSVFLSLSGAFLFIYLFLFFIYLFFCMENVYNM